MKIRTAQFGQGNALAHCLDSLRSALGYAKFADCPKLANKIRSAIKSHGGATRHMRHRLRRGNEIT